MDLEPPPGTPPPSMCNSHLPEDGDLVFPIACRGEMNVPGGGFRRNWIAKAAQESTHLNGVGTRARRAIPRTTTKNIHTDYCYLIFS